MKYVWEDHDIVAGRRVQSKNRPNEIFMIGYDPLVDGNKFTLTSLNDGMLVKRAISTCEMAREFNDNGMRPMDIRLDDVGSKI